MHTDQLMSIGEAARRLGVSVDTMRRWADEGQVSTVRTVGGHRRFKESEVLDLIAANGDAA